MAAVVPISTNAGGKVVSCSNRKTTHPSVIKPVGGKLDVSLVII